MAEERNKSQQIVTNQISSSQTQQILIQSVSSTQAETSGKRKQRSSKWEMHEDLALVQGMKKHVVPKCRTYGKRRREEKLRQEDGKM